MAFKMGISVPIKDMSLKEFSAAKIQKQNLQIVGSELKGVDFSDSQFVNTRVSKSTMDRTSFARVQCDSIIFTGSFLKDTSFEGLQIKLGEFALLDSMVNLCVFDRMAANLFTWADSSATPRDNSFRHIDVENMFIKNPCYDCDFQKAKIGNLEFGMYSSEEACINCRFQGAIIERLSHTRFHRDPSMWNDWLQKTRKIIEASGGVVRRIQTE